MQDAVEEINIAQVVAVLHVLVERVVVRKSVAHGNVAQHVGDGRRKIYRFDIVAREDANFFRMARDGSAVVSGSEAGIFAPIKYTFSLKPVRT